MHTMKVHNGLCKFALHCNTEFHVKNLEVQHRFGLFFSAEFQTKKCMLGNTLAEQCIHFKYCKMNTEN